MVTTDHLKIKLLLCSYWTLQVTHLVTTKRGDSLRLPLCYQFELDRKVWEDKTDLVQSAPCLKGRSFLSGTESLPF